jgi:hypothetical protein
LIGYCIEIIQENGEFKMSKIDLSALLGTMSDESDDVSSGEKKTREGGKVGAYRRAEDVINAHISRHEEDGNADVVDALTSLLTDLHKVRDAHGVPQSAKKRYIGQDESGTLVGFESDEIPTPATFSDYTKVWGTYRKDGLAFRLANGIPDGELTDRLVFARKSA